MPIQMTPRQRRKGHALIRKLCCNYDSGNCLALDDGEPCVCVQSISYSFCCTWFREWVLPGAPVLYAEIMQPKGLKRCAECGTLFLAKSNRAKYCSDCAHQGTSAARKQRVTGNGGRGRTNRAFTSRIYTRFRDRQLRR